MEKIINVNTQKHYEILEELKDDVTKAFNFTKVKKYTKASDKSPYYHHIIGKDDTLTLFDIFLDDQYITINVSDKVITDYCSQLNKLLELMQEKRWIEIHFYKVKE